MTPAVTPSQKKLNLYQQLQQQLKVMNADEISSAFICVYLLISAVKKIPNLTTSLPVKTTEAKFYGSFVPRESLSVPAKAKTRELP